MVDPKPKEREWIPTSRKLPPERFVVETKTHDELGCRNEQDLRRKGSLWWFADGSMYCYYVPTHWRPKE